MGIELGGIMIPPAFFCNHEISFFFKVANDSLHCSFGNVYFLGDVSHTEIGLAAEKDEYVCVIRKEVPISHDH